jgi:ribonuclease H2 subunit A
VYVDALGATGPYERLLSSHFPGINFTVTAKADSKFKIVGAASVAAKVTRDAWIEGWIFEEDANECSEMTGVQAVKRLWSQEVGSGYPSGVFIGISFPVPPKLTYTISRSKYKDMGEGFS